MFKVHFRLTYVAKKKKRLLKLQPYWFNEFAVVVESIGGRLKPNNQQQQTWDVFNYFSMDLEVDECKINSICSLEYLM